jgi:hypothetical protein
MEIGERHEGSALLPQAEDRAHWSPAARRIKKAAIPAVRLDLGSGTSDEPG